MFNLGKGGEGVCEGGEPTKLKIFGQKGADLSQRFNDRISWKLNRGGAPKGPPNASKIEKSPIAEWKGKRQGQALKVRKKEPETGGIGMRSKNLNLFGEKTTNDLIRYERGSSRTPARVDRQNPQETRLGWVKEIKPSVERKRSSTIGEIDE